MIGALLLAGCSGSPSAPSDATTFTFDFDQGRQGFVAGFADYPPAYAADYMLTSDHRPLPAPLDTARRALFISGINRSDDLLMFFTGPVTGLRPGASYDARVSVEFATSAPAGCAGVGGAPGESVWIKAGATTTEPLAVNEGSHLRMNIDMGNQSTGGANATVLGNVANSRSCEQPLEWELKSLEAAAGVQVEADADGRAWLLFGADSRFESLTALYFTRVSVTFAPL